MWTFTGDWTEITKHHSFKSSGLFQSGIKGILTSTSGTIYQIQSAEIWSYGKKERKKERKEGKERKKGKGKEKRARILSNKDRHYKQGVKQKN